MLAGAVNWIFRANTLNATRSLGRLQRTFKTGLNVSGNFAKGLGRLAPVFVKLGGGVAAAGNGLLKFGGYVKGMIFKLGKLIFWAKATGFALGAIVVAIGKNLRETQRWADSLNIPAKRLEAMQRVGSRYGITAERMADATKDLNEKISDAKSGAKVYVEALGAMGLKWQDLIGLRADEQMFKVTEAMQKMSVAGDQSFRVMELMADAGFDMLPLIRKNGDAFEKLTLEAENSETALSDLERGSLLSANTAFTKMMGVLGDLTNKLGAKFAPAFERFFNYVSDNAPELYKTIKGVALNIYNSFKDNLMNAGDMWDGFFKGIDDNIASIKSKYEGFKEWLNGLNPTNYFKDIGAQVVNQIHENNGTGVDAVSGADTAGTEDGKGKPKKSIRQMLSEWLHGVPTTMENLENNIQKWFETTEGGKENSKPPQLGKGVTSLVDNKKRNGNALSYVSMRDMFKSMGLDNYSQTDASKNKYSIGSMSKQIDPNLIKLGSPDNAMVSETKKVVKNTEKIHDAVRAAVEAIHQNKTKERFPIVSGLGNTAIV